MNKTPREASAQPPTRTAILAKERELEAERGIADETERLSGLKAKTKRLKAMREARDAALREAIRKEAQAKKQAKPKLGARPKKGGK